MHESSGSHTRGHPPLAVLARPKMLDGRLVLVVNQSHGDRGIPTAFIGTTEIYLLIVVGDNGEVDVFSRPLNTIQLLDGLELEFLALGLLLAISEHVEAILGQDALLLSPEL